jgi:repressor LexA
LSSQRSGYPPSVREIGRAGGLASTAAGAADDAEARRPGTVSVPLFDRIAAGAPVVADREQVGILELPRQQVGSGELIAVEVAGDSMAEAGIFHGDAWRVNSSATASARARRYTPASLCVVPDWPRDVGR